VSNPEYQSGHSSFPLVTERSAVITLDESGIQNIDIPLWPYGLKEEETKKKGQAFAVRILDSQFIALLFGINFALFSAFLVSSSFGGASLLILPAFLALPLFGSYFLLREAAYIRIYKWGFTVQWMVFGKVVKEQQVYWRLLNKIYLEQVESDDNSILKAHSAKIVFETVDGVRFSLNLQSIPSLEEWQKLLQAAREWGGLSAITIDPAIEQSFGQKDNENSYTELWLETLSAAPERERLQPLTEGTLLQNARYKVIRLIASGGQGTAYLAENNAEVGQPVVLKEYILPVYVDIKARRYALDSLEQEASLLKSLNHPNVVQFTGFFVEDHRAYLVEEFVKGESLRASVQRNGPAPPLVAVRLGVVMTDILSYLHSCSPKVIHRDFTPDNLIYDQLGNLKVIDFTVAQRGEDSALNTAVGKQCYLPPEQFRGKATTQSDIYALGATLYFLLKGEDPEPLTQSRLKDRSGDVYEALDFIIARATALDLTERYQHAEEARGELMIIERYLSGGQSSSVL